MREKLEQAIIRYREKLQAIEEKLFDLSVEYMDLLDTDETSIHLKRLKNEMNYLEKQQDATVNMLRDKKKQLQKMMMMI